MTKGYRNPELFPEMLAYHLGVFDVDCWPADGSQYVFARRSPEPVGESPSMEGDWSGRALLYPPNDADPDEIRLALMKVGEESREFLAVLPDAAIDDDMDVSEPDMTFHKIEGGALLAVGPAIHEMLHSAIFLEIV